MRPDLHSLATAAALAVLAALAPPAAAHDLWLEVSDATPAVGATVALDVRVGDRFPGDPLPHRPAATVRLAVVGPGGDRALHGPPAGPPAARFAVERAGDLAVVFRSTEAAIELPAAKFEGYLAEEGLEAVLARRAAAGESERPGRELYSRSVKALLRAGESGAAGAGESVHTLATGLELELVPATSPYDLAPGDELEVVLLWHGRPLAGALVEAVRREEPGAVYARRTDARGSARFPLPAPGFWRLTTVHMQAADGRAADWQSVWSALTFSLDD